MVSRGSRFFIWCPLSSLYIYLKKYMHVFLAYISTGQIMGWGNKAIEIRSAETGHLDGVFMHKKAQKLKFLCERNDKVSPAIPLYPKLESVVTFIMVG